MELSAAISRDSRRHPDSGKDGEKTERGKVRGARDGDHTEPKEGLKTEDVSNDEGCRRRDAGC